jgi:hypothetical protein
VWRAARISKRAFLHRCNFYKTSQRKH